VALIQFGRLAEQLIHVFHLDRLPTGQVLEDESVHVMYPVPDIGARCTLAFDTASIDGTTASFLDTGANNQMPFGDEDYTVDRLRLWNPIMCVLDTVPGTDIEVRATVIRPGVVNGNVVYRELHARPSWVPIGPFRVEPGYQLRITTHNNGGIGENMDVYWSGWTAPPGGNVPVVPV